MRKNQILVAVTGINKTTEQILMSLYEKELLYYLYTTLFFSNKDRIFGKIPATLSRQVNFLPKSKICSWPWIEILRLVSSKVDKSRISPDLIWEIGDKLFARHVGKNLGDANAVIGFEHSSLEIFKAAHKKGVKCIYDVPSAYSPLVKKILAPIRQKNSELNDAYARHTSRIEARRQARRDLEYCLADIIIVHSKFTLKSYIEAGYSEKCIINIPYGAPPINQLIYNKLIFDQQSSPVTNPPIFIFAGNFALHKGALVLWEAWTKLKLSGARLLIAGEVHLPPQTMSNSPAGIEYLGKLAWPVLQQLYQSCTALVFPSLSDGFGMVVSEAMSQGLPVITTPNVGASDLIESGKNGLIVPILDADALANAMHLLAEDSILLRTLRTNAIQSAKKWQWQDFRNQLSDVISSKLDAIL